MTSRGIPGLLLRNLNLVAIMGMCVYIYIANNRVSQYTNLNQIPERQPRHSVGKRESNLHFSTASEYLLLHNSPGCWRDPSSTPRFATEARARSAMWSCEIPRKCQGLPLWHHARNLQAWAENCAKPQANYPTGLGLSDEGCICPGTLHLSTSAVF